MGKFLSIIVVIIVGIAVFLYLDKKVDILQFNATPTPSASPNSNEQTVSTPEVTFSYGSEFGLATTKAQILVSSYIPSCDEDLDYCLYYKANAYVGTNFESAGLRINRRVDLKTKTACVETQPTGYQDLRPVAQDGTGYSTSVFADLGQAGAGHYADGELYRLWFGTTCYEFETRIGETQFANYPEGSIQKFTDSDRAVMEQKLKALLDTVAISSTGVHPTWAIPVSVVSPTATPSKNTIRIDYARSEIWSAGVAITEFNKLLSDARLRVYPKQNVVYKPPDWPAVKATVYSAASVQKGADYIRANFSAFEKAQTDYGVPKEALAGLIRLETDFGNNAGDYTVFNALYSRMLQWPETTWRAQAKQLAAFTQYCLGSGIDCFGVKGSYAGAFGIVQFMPDSLLAYGVDGDANSIIELSNPVDAIPSAARYLKEHGWATDLQTALARYYGSAEGYPEIVLTYASLLK